MAGNPQVGLQLPWATDSSLGGYMTRLLANQASEAPQSASPRLLRHYADVQSAFLRLPFIAHNSRVEQLETAQFGALS